MRKRTLALVPLASLAMLVYFSVGASAAIIIGTNQPDTITATSGTNTIVGKGGGDTLTGYNNADVIVGNGEGDWIGGAGGNDMLAGENGADTMYGGNGNDIVSGGAGDDDIFTDGDGKVDIVTCGADGGTTTVDAIDEVVWQSIFPCTIVVV